MVGPARQRAMCPAGSAADGKEHGGVHAKTKTKCYYSNGGRTAQVVRRRLPNISARCGGSLCRSLAPARHLINSEREPEPYPWSPPHRTAAPPGARSGVGSSTFDVAIQIHVHIHRIRLSKIRSCTDADAQNPNSDEGVQSPVRGICVGVTLYRSSYCTCTVGEYHHVPVGSYLDTSRAPNPFLSPALWRLALGPAPASRTSFCIGGCNDRPSQPRLDGRGTLGN
jgi:hypothetical protein